MTELLVAFAFMDALNSENIGLKQQIRMLQDTAFTVDGTLVEKCREIDRLNAEIKRLLQGA